MTREQEPTTKNDLGVDAISRIETIDYLCKHCPDDGECFEDCDEIKYLRQLSSVTPQEPILDKIRTEIEQAADKQFQIAMGVSDLNERYAHIQMENAYRHSLNVIDKYKAESEDKE